MQNSMTKIKNIKKLFRKNKMNKKKRNESKKQIKIKKK